MEVSLSILWKMGLKPQEVSSSYILLYAQRCSVSDQLHMVLLGCCHSHRQLSGTCCFGWRWWGIGQ